MSKINKKTVSLVLGSGGARGLAHIGVIRWLEENDFQIKSISGSSAGAVVGGIYAAGKLDDFEQWIKAISKVDIVRMLDLSWTRSGLVKGDKIINTLTELVGDVNIEDLPITFTAVATDILNEKEVWLSSGKLFDAIRASISLPLFFTPYKHHGVDLIDGGVLNPVPIAPTFNDSTDITIAVNLGGQIEEKIEVSTINDEKNEEGSLIASKINDFVKSFKGSTVEDINKEWGVFEIANLAFDAMQSSIARQKLAAYPPDYSIEIARNACGILEFSLSSQMIELGYSKAKETLSGIAS